MRGHATVVQRIERAPPKRQIQVRFLSEAPSQRPPTSAGVLFSGVIPLWDGVGSSAGVRRSVPASGALGARIGGTFWALGACIAEARAPSCARRGLHPPARAECDKTRQICAASGCLARGRAERPVSTRRVNALCRWPENFPHLNPERGRNFLNAVERRISCLAFQVRNECSMQPRLGAQPLLRPATIPAQADHVQRQRLPRGQWDTFCGSGDSLHSDAASSRVAFESAVFESQSDWTP